MPRSLIEKNSRASRSSFDRVGEPQGNSGGQSLLKPPQRLPEALDLTARRQGNREPPSSGAIEELLPIYTQFLNTQLLHARYLDRRTLLF